MVGGVTQRPQQCLSSSILFDGKGGSEWKAQSPLRSDLKKVKKIDRTMKVWLGGGT